MLADFPLKHFEPIITGRVVSGVVTVLLSEDEAFRGIVGAQKAMKMPCGSVSQYLYC